MTAAQEQSSRPLSIVMVQRAVAGGVGPHWPDWFLRKPQISTDRSGAVLMAGGSQNFWRWRCRVAANLAKLISPDGLCRLLPPSTGPRPSIAQVMALADAFQKAFKSPLPIVVVLKPSKIDGAPVNVPAGTNPTGAVIVGKIYLFTDNLLSIDEAGFTIFHELFHFGLYKVLPASALVGCRACTSAARVIGLR